MRRQAAAALLILLGSASSALAQWPAGPALAPARDSLPLRLGLERRPLPFAVHLRPGAGFVPWPFRADFAADPWALRARLAFAPDRTPWPGRGFPPLTLTVLAAARATAPAAAAPAAAGPPPAGQGARPAAAAPDTTARGPPPAALDSLGRPATGLAGALTGHFAPPAPADTGGTQGRLLPPSLSRYANIGMEVSGRGELGGAWTRFRPCDPAVQLGCNPGLFPQLRPDLNFAVKVGGTISKRIHVNVDYDQRREFSAANNINVYYQGLPGEFLQRVEVGDVSIKLPSSRYLTEGIPGGNFGFRATAQDGPLHLETVFAQQKGDVMSRQFQLGGLGGGGSASGSVSEDQHVVLDGSDYVKGQFFFILDPRQLEGYPQIDVLNLTADAAPASLRPAPGTSIVLYRDERPSLTNPEQQAQLGYFLANAVSADGTVHHTGLFRRLVPGTDYVMHSSGLWFVLRTPLRPDEALAVGYVTATGDTVGALVVPGRNSTGPTPVLRLIRPPTTQHQPGQPTWEYEMHQVYRVSGASNLDPSTVKLQISLGELAAGRTFEQVAGQQVPFLRLFGLDDEAPRDQLDASRIYQPGTGGLAGSPTDVRVTGTFIVFPTLMPFADPPATPDLSVAQAKAALGADANPEIYNDPDPVARQNDSRFRLSLDYTVPVEGNAASFSLGAFGIRQGSERITVNGRPLRRGIDYTIDYDLGTVTLLHPADVLGASPNAQVRATWEQKAAFDIAPTTLAGLTAHYDLGHAGGLDLVGLYRKQNTLETRPQLGMEPASIMLGGISGSVDLGGGLLRRALSVLPLQRDTTAALSDVKLSGEMALSLPDPNTKGVTYLDDFEATDETSLSLQERDWTLGSRPDQVTGAESVMPAALDTSNAARLVWQHAYKVGSQVVGALTPLAIDSLIDVAGAQIPEPVMYLTFGGHAADQWGASSGTGWRSITTVLNPTGRDLSQTEYLEFYVDAPQGRNLALVVDLGTISEDAYYVSPQGATNGVYPDGTPWGLGVLDEEAHVGQGEVWGPEQDKRGLWNEPCEAQPGQTYPLGDARANCTRDNGYMDTEDLDGNGLLDANDGPYFRYVVPLDQLTPYLVRDRSQTHTGFQLYRIPLRASGLALNGANDGTWRFIKELRLTVTGLTDATSTIEMARLRFIGSRYVKRSGDGVLQGMTSDLPGLGAGATNVRVGPVSRITDGAAYSSPPGVISSLQNPSQAYGLSGAEYNEKSLRIAFDQLDPGERAEAYYRYPQQPRNLLSYRDLRLWAVAPARTGVAAGDLRLLVKVGTDANDYYLYQARLTPAPSADVHPNDWLPERVVDFQQWFDLRAQAEQALEQRDTTGGTSTQPIVVWSADSSYAVVLQDRARAPNLAAVRELSFAVYNASSQPLAGEVWIDDLRLSAGVTTPGLAGHVALDFRAGDFLTGSAGFSGRSAFYRQLQTGAAYQSNGDYTLDGTARLGRLMPRSWGIALPVTFQLQRSAVNPFFLQQSDVLASQLHGLRSSGARSTHIGLTLRRARPVKQPVIGALVNGTQITLNYSSASDDAIISADHSRTFDAGLNYEYRPAGRALELTPGFVDDVLRHIAPGWIERTRLFQSIIGARLRWTPVDLALASDYRSSSSTYWRYAGVLQTPAANALAPVVSPSRLLDDEVRVALRPFASMGAGIDIRSGRDLLPPDLSGGGALEQQAISRERWRFAGVPVGWERQRFVDSHFDWRPPITNWLRPGLSFHSSYSTSSSPTQLQLDVLGADTLAFMQRGYTAQRQYTRSLQILPAEMLDSTAFGRLLGHVRPVNLSWDNAISSRFERGLASPGLAFQLGLGGPGSFQAVGGDTAATALVRDLFRTRSGIALPLGAEFDVGYSRGRASILNRVGGDQNQVQRTWPDLQFSWAAVPLPGIIAGMVTRLTLATGYRLTRRTNRLTGGAGEVQGGSESTVPLQLGVQLGPRLDASYTGSLTRGTSFDATGAARSAETDHGVQVAGSFLAPAALRGHFPQPFRLSLQYRYQARDECRLDTGVNPGCAPFVDLINRDVHMTLETIVSNLDVGLEMSYTDRQSFIGTHSGSTQFQLGVFGQFRFAQGRLPRSFR